MGVSVSPAIHKIAVFRALYLGDMICATPALKALRGRFPAADITLIGLPWVAELLPRLGLVDRLEIFPGFPGMPEAPYEAARSNEFFDRMRAERFDLVLQMHGDGSVSNAFASLLEGRISLGYSRRPDHDQRLSFVIPWQSDDHEIQRWLKLVRVLGADTDERVLYPLTADDQLEATRLLARVSRPGAPLVGIHCGAKLPSRRWPVDRFAEVANGLAAQAGAGIVLTGSPVDEALTWELRELIEYPVLDLTGKTDLGTLGAVVSQLDLILTNDTGISHVAAATGTRSVVLFGPSDPKVWAPLDARRHVVIDAAAGGRERSDTVLTALETGVVLDRCLAVLKRGAVNQRSLMTRPAHAMGVG